MNLNYDEGVSYMIDICSKAKNKEMYANHFMVGNLKISYPGRKKIGDYRMEKGGKMHTHSDIVRALYNYTNASNYKDLISALDSLYINGLKCTNKFFKTKIKELVYWITLQEDINYPPEKYAGRKLAYQRFYEAVLAKLGITNIDKVISRTNNHLSGRPSLFELKRIEIP